VYVSFASCGLVARVEIKSGRILDGVQFRAGQPPAIVGPDVTCPVECTDFTTGDEAQSDAGVVAQPPDAGPAASAPPQPAAMDMDPLGDHLYLGAFDSPDLVVVDLDTSGAPTAAHTLTLEGAGGITRVAATGNVAFSGVSGFLRFVYAIGQDQAIHVANVTPGRTLTECETQLDTRYLHDFTSQSTLPCFPIGSADPRVHPPGHTRAPG